MARKNKSPFDLDQLYKDSMKDTFGFSIESSFVDGPNQKQILNKIRKKKYHDARYQQLKTGSTEAFSPSEEHNVYGVYRID